MSSGLGLSMLVLIVLAAGALLRARAIARMMPALDAAAAKHNATIRRSFPGLPQIIKPYRARALRLTPMSISTSSPEGGGGMTCVDFDWPAPQVGEFRMREKSDARRNAVPTASAGGSGLFTVGDPQLDARFSIAGTDPAAAARILTVAAVVESIAALPAGADIRVRDGKCCVCVKGYPDRPELMDRLFDLSERLLDESLKDADGS